MNIRKFISKIQNSSSVYPNLVFSEPNHIYTCVNPYSYHIVRNNVILYERMDGLFVDGILMCKLIKLLWKVDVKRLSFDMSAMAADLFNDLNKSSKSIYFIGSTQENITKSINQIKTAYPNMKVCGFRNGYFSSIQERANVINEIIDLHPDYVIVGMGSPLQEQFCFDLKQLGFTGIAFTCGGFLHQAADNIHYYPEWINRYNLRAFYRLYIEKGLWKRLYNVLIEFPILFLLDTISTRILKLDE